MCAQTLSFAAGSGVASVSPPPSKSLNPPYMSLGAKCNPKSCQIGETGPCALEPQCHEVKKTG